MSSLKAFRHARRSLIPVLIILVMLLFIVVSVSADDKAGSTNSGSAVGFTPITGSPLTINVAVDASYQVIHDAVDPSSPGQVFPTGLDEADAGLFVWNGGWVIGPDFDNHDASASNSYDPWTSVSQSLVLGSGTIADPWIVETDVAHGASGTTMSADTIYVNGDDYFRIDWEICLPAAGSISTFLAADIYLQGSDNGFGYYDAATGSVGGFNAAQDWFEIFTPLTPASAYYEGGYSEVWFRIGSAGAAGAGFDNTIVNSEIDNGAGLQWDRDIDGCESFSSFWSFGETPVLPPTSVALADFAGQSSANLTLAFAGILAVLFASFILLRHRLIKGRA
jgi:hypothetical protein